MSRVAYAWDMAGRPTLFVPKCPYLCEECEKDTSAVFVSNEKTGWDQWVCPACLEEAGEDAHIVEDRRYRR